MSDLRSKLIRLAYENPDLREDLVPLLQTQNDYGSREAQVLMNFDGGRYDVKPPRSMYDRLQDAPFKWSTPAQNFNGTYPMPWRVADADAAKKMVMRIAKRAGLDVRDLYVDHWSGYQGHQTLWIGLRNNRYKDEHRFRLRELHKELKKFTKAVMEDGWIMLVDDLEKNALR